MCPEESNFIERKTEFKWHSRQDIYDFFTQTGLSVRDIDERIKKAFDNFVVRSGAPINTDQLWQKVGDSMYIKYYL